MNTSDNELDIATREALERVTVRQRKDEETEKRIADRIKELELSIATHQALERVAVLQRNDQEYLKHSVACLEELELSIASRKDTHERMNY